MAALQYWLWLSAAAVSPRAKAALIENYGDAESVWNAPAGNFVHVAGVTAQEASILENRDLSNANRIAGACEEQGIRILTYQDAEYPGRLRNIFAPPVVLYVKGKLPDVDNEALIAVIGTRKASAYGLKMGRDLAFQICCCGGKVVSLLTGGVDAEAAKGALSANGYCIGVLGTAHEEEYGYLARELSVRGAVVSEIPPGVRSQKHFFRDRNRIAAGLSAGVVVVEAPERSGTRLFAQEALEQGKEIFAVPGNADSENSVGTLSLIQEGAKLVTCGWDVLTEFESRFPGKLSDQGRRPAPISRPFSGRAADAAEQNLSVDKDEARGYIDLREQLSALSEDELLIVTAIGKGPTHADDIIEKSGLPTALVLKLLTMLTIKKYVSKRPGNYYVLNITKK